MSPKRKIYSSVV
ncbi:ce41b249-1fad-4f68-961b-512a503a1a62 [Thermothielavioides terrestris]|uniref:Ce41b249-1fad-4f68-961b-512a503a1a62 n=1 Tax=Thermothielavioides terrestris TaxID=2587410 RepID=A0A3S4AKT2_9PEZI|nr:ce41b249-1fad-4f68-961b-512a503a1a62 [Thermothielavioides terrestris]